jgi:hypothetical protein
MSLPIRAKLGRVLLRRGQFEIDSQFAIQAFGEFAIEQ